MPFSLTTYNVLAQAYITPTRYPRTPAPVLTSAWRRPALVRHIVALGTDVVCLQEVEDETFAAVQQALQPLGYTGHFAKKGGGKPDGCATFVRQNTLTWGTVHQLMYSDGAGIERDSGHLALGVVGAYKGRLLGLVNTHLQGIRQAHLQTASVALDRSGSCCKSVAALPRAVRRGLSVETST